MYNEVSPHTDQNGHIKKPTAINSAEGVKRRQPSYTVGRILNGTLSREYIIRGLKKLSIEVPSDAAISYQGLDPEKNQI